jgi:two-component system LytT family response regulator
MRALIVDDELHAREELESLLLETGAFTIAGGCGNAVEAIQAIRKERPDVVFLDIQMPAISGFELLSMLEDDELPAIVFVTAHDEFALRAFEQSALDYLLKPVARERLAKTVERLRRLPGGGAPRAYPHARIKRIPCLAARAVKLVDLADVEFVKSSEAGVYVVTAGGELFTELTLKVLEDRASLLRCHKQYLVNVDRIDEISLGENSLAVIKTKSGQTVPVSRRHLSKLRAALGL